MPRMCFETIFKQALENCDKQIVIGGKVIDNNLRCAGDTLL